MSKARDIARAGTALANVDATELGYLDGVTSNVQTQIDAKLASATAASTYQPLVANVSDTEIGYLDGVTSAIQTQLNTNATAASTAQATADAAVPKSGYDAAGKNKIINGDFGIWQRGTSFTNPANSSYTADRFTQYRDGAGSTVIISQQTFTAGAAPVVGYEGTTFYRFNQSVAGTGATYSVIGQYVEDVRTFANQTVTFSFWAKADATRSITPQLIQSFGSGGSSAVYIAGSAINLTTSWARYTTTLVIPSISGKTIGTNSYLAATLNMPLNTTQTIDIWGWQLEAGSTATQFQTATGTIQGELAACQRYYLSLVNNNFQAIGVASFYNSTDIHVGITFPVTMRIAPSLVVSNSAAHFLIYVNGASKTFPSFTIASPSTNEARIYYSGISPAGTAGQTAFAESNNASAVLAFNAEL